MEMALVESIHEELPTTPHVLCRFHLLDNWQNKAARYGIKELLCGEKAVYGEFWKLLKGLLYFDIANELTLAVVRDILEDFITRARETNMDRHSYLENFYTNYIDRVYLNPQTRNYRPQAVSGDVYKLFLDCNFITSTGDAECAHRQIKSLLDNVAFSKKWVFLSWKCKLNNI